MDQIKLLAVTGRHDYDESAFFLAFENDPGISLTRIEHSPPPPGSPRTFTVNLSADAWDRADPTEYDAVVLYDTGRNITDAQKARFLSMFDAGVGAVFLHHSITCYTGWDEYDQIIGGRYILGRGPNRSGSGASDHDYHPEDPPFSDVRGADPDLLRIPIRMYDKEHPITQGLNDFVVYDEAFNGLRLQPHINPLIVTDQIHAGNPYGWYHSYRQSRIVYLQLAHSGGAQSHPDYQRLVQRCVRWVAEPRLASRSGTAAPATCAPTDAPHADLIVG